MKPIMETCERAARGPSSHLRTESTGIQHSLTSLTTSYRPARPSSSPRPSEEAPCECSRSITEHRQAVHAG